METVNYNYDKVFSWPLVGNIPEILTGLVSTRGNLAEAMGKFFKPGGPLTVRFKLGPKYFMATQDMDFIQEILKKNPHLYSKTPWEHRVLNPLMKKGLILAQGEDWKRRRQILNPYFNKPYLTNLIGVARKATLQRFDVRWEGKINFSHELMCVGTNILISYFMGDALMGELDGEQPIDFYVNIFRKMEKDLEGMVLPHPTLKKRSIKKNLEMAMGPIRTRVLKRSPTDLSVMSRILNDFNNEEEVFQEFGTIFGAAATTVHALSWLGHLLGKHPIIQEKVRAEIDAFIKRSNYPEGTTLEDLEQLNYLTAVIREGMRLYPPAPLMLRTPDKGVIKGEKIQAIFIPIWLLNRNPKFWDDPLDFRPERWIVSTHDGQVRLKNVDQFIPFGDGPRICIGMRFSLIESRIILIEMLRRFKLDSRDQKTPPAKTDILTRPAKDIYLNITKTNL